MGFKNKKYFTIGQNIFWILIILLISFLFFHLADSMFDGSGIAEELVFQETKPVPDTSTINPETDTSALKNDSVLYNWQWFDFNGNNNAIQFYFHKDDLSKAKKNRIKFPISSTDIYLTLYNHDKLLLQNLIAKMKQNIKRKNLSYFEAIEYVCSSIQYIPYTLVQVDQNCPCVEYGMEFTANCVAQDDGRGCCRGVIPFAVYSPVEFTCLKTGDCDTRALLAFTFLKEMGFDVAVMVSFNEGHSVLGLNLPDAGNYSYGIGNTGKKFALWELTSKDWRFGRDRVQGNDWEAALE